MKCLKCQTDNPDDSKFCKECATPFPGTGGAVPTKTLETSVKGIAEGTIVADKYRIIKLLGRGGMGVVYKAEDLKLKRTVALKFLAPELILEKEAKERFILEAQAASSLNHPNICTIHEIDEINGQMYIAMAYVEGKNLREQTAQGPFKLEEALNLILQIAEGLHEAHEKGIIHRDIKSSNIMITDKGQAIIMDFGIAKLAGETKITRTGTTMGTVAYMSPEQARGAKVDHKTDIWSLGVVLYEMVIGQLPFGGDHEQAVIYSILNENPLPMTGLRTGIPMELERIASKAMQKESRVRYQNTVDMLVDLKYLKENLTSFLKSPVFPGLSPATLQASRWKRLLPWGLMILIAFVFTWQWISVSRQVKSHVTRFTIDLRQHSGSSTSGSLFGISPDGTKIVFSGLGEAGRQLYRRSLDQLESEPIPGTEGAVSPFFSPDGQWVGFFVGRILKKIALDGGPARTLADDAYYGGGASWGADDLIVFWSTCEGGLLMVSGTGGIPEVITSVKSDQGEIYHLSPDILPNGKAVLFNIHTAGSALPLIVALSLETGEIKTFKERGVRPRYVSTGHIIYANDDGQLLALPFNSRKLEEIGSPRPLLEGISARKLTADFALSSSGSLVYANATEFAYLPSRMLFMVDRSGKEQLLLNEPYGFRAPRFSPDGRQIAIRINDGGSDFDIYLYGLETGLLTKLTHGEGDNLFPAWSPNGERISFCSTRARTYDLYWKKSDGTGAAELLLASELRLLETCFSHDGKLLVYREEHPDTGRDIRILSLDGEGKSRTFLNSPSMEVSPVLSHDDRYLAYTVIDESGKEEVFVRTFPNPDGGLWQVSFGGGAEPIWSKDGKELFYRSKDKFVSVSIETDPVFKIGAKKELFEDKYMKVPSHSNYDIHPDGNRFVMLKQLDLEGTFKIIVVQNWFKELRQAFRDDEK